MIRRFSIAVILLMGLALPVAAHPLGNFTTNVHLGVVIEDDAVALDLVVDMAEIPTFREPLDIDGDGSVTDPELVSYAADTCADLRGDVSLDADDSPVALTSTSTATSLLPGEGDLETLRIECGFVGSLTADVAQLSVSNQVFAERTGWVEMVVTGGVAEGIPSVSSSAVLTDYPDTTPLSQREAVIVVGVDGEATAVATTANDDVEASGITARLATGLTESGSTGGFLALAAAVGLGVTHALAPGHGKTLMAAYLVGRRGRPRQAVGLGMAVAVSHTIGVAVLGLITAVASSAFQPEQVYPWLTTGSALIVTGLGIALLVKAIRGRGHHHHGDHDHGDHDHDHDHHQHHEDLPDLGWRSLAALGLAGGLVPSASAVVLLLGAVAIGRPWFGVGLVFAFGIGMSIALVGAGLVALKLTTAGLKRLEGRTALPARLLPALAGVAVTTVGGFLLWDGLRTLV